MQQLRARAVPSDDRLTQLDDDVAFKRVVNENAMFKSRHLFRRYVVKMESSGDWTAGRRQTAMADVMMVTPASLPPPPPPSSGDRLNHRCRMWTKWILLIGTSLFTMFSFMALTLILIYETDFHWAIHLRHWPEMVFIQRHLYIPFRSLFPL